MNLGRQWGESANPLAYESFSGPTSSWKAALLLSLQDQHRKSEDGGKGKYSRGQPNYFVN